MSRICSRADLNVTKNFKPSKKYISDVTEQLKETNENQRVSDLSKKRHRKENIPNADENESKND